MACWVRAGWQRQCGACGGQGRSLGGPEPQPGQSRPATVLGSRPGAPAVCVACSKRTSSDADESYAACPLEPAAARGRLPAEEIADETLHGRPGSAEQQAQQAAQPKAGAVEVLAPAGGGLLGGQSSEEDEDDEGGAGGGGALLGLAYGSDEEGEEEGSQGQVAAKGGPSGAPEEAAAEAAPAAASPRPQPQPQPEQPAVAASQQQPEASPQQPEQPAVAPRQRPAPPAARPAPLYTKGDEVLYIERDGARSVATVVAVDLTIDPPSYAARLHAAATVRETEGHRLEPLPPGWHAQQAPSAAQEAVQADAAIATAGQVSGCRALR